MGGKGKVLSPGLALATFVPYLIVVIFKQPAMSAQNPPFDLSQLEAVVLKVLQNNPEIVKSALTDMIAPAKDQPTSEKDARRNKMREMIEKDFSLYDEVFKALA